MQTIYLGGKDVAACPLWKAWGVSKSWTLGVCRSVVAGWCTSKTNATTAEMHTVGFSITDQIVTRKIF